MSRRERLFGRGRRGAVPVARRNTVATETAEPWYPIPPDEPYRKWDNDDDEGTEDDDDTGTTE